MEHDHLEQVAGPVGSEDEGPHWRFVIAHVGDHERVSDGVQDIVGLHTVFASLIGELHTDESLHNRLCEAFAGTS